MYTIYTCRAEVPVPHLRPSYQSPGLRSSEHIQPCKQPDVRPAGRHYNLPRRVYPPSVPRAFQYWRKSNLESFLRAASFMYAAISRRAASFRSTGASTSTSGGAGNLLVHVRSDLVYPGHSRRGPCFRPGAPRPPPRAFGACLSCLGASRALAITADTGADTPRAESNIAAKTRKLLN